MNKIYMAVNETTVADVLVVGAGPTGRAVSEEPRL